MVRYEQWPPRQTGGQVAGVGPQGVRGIHEIDGAPTGVEACCMLHRSQHKNREAVREMIEWALVGLKYPPPL